ncbi:FadR family transcriptional regulator [Paraburkholderia aspalathi]|nr:FadR family transcriptional regulator [Paraburkholderia aspalathi]
MAQHEQLPNSVPNLVQDQLQAPVQDKSQSPTRPRVKNNVITALAVDIASDIYPSGSFLPRESDLCERYGVSRTVIREVLKVLESKGLVYGRPRVGTMVCERNEWNILDPQVLEWLGDDIFKLSVLDCILETRQVIEPIAARLAAERATVQEIADLDYAWQMMNDAGDDLAAFTEGDMLFHTCLLKASHNQVFFQLSRTIGAALQYALHTSNEAAITRSEALEIHRQLVEALRMRDKDAAVLRSQQILDLAKRDLNIAVQKRLEATTKPV